MDDLKVFDDLLKEVFIHIFELENDLRNSFTHYKILDICRQASHSLKIKNPYVVFKDIENRMDSVYRVKFQSQKSRKTDREKILDWVYYEVVCMLSKNLIQSECNHLNRYVTKLKQVNGCYSLSKL